MVMARVLPSAWVMRARLTQALEVEMDGGGGFQPHGLGNLPHRGGVAVFVGESQDVVVDLLLFGG